MVRARAILGEVEHGVAAWRQEGRALGIDAAGLDAAGLDALAEAFEHEERAAARRLL